MSHRALHLDHIWSVAYFLPLSPVEDLYNSAYLGPRSPSHLSEEECWPACRLVSEGLTFSQDEGKCFFLVSDICVLFGISQCFLVWSRHPSKREFALRGTLPKWKKAGGKKKKRSWLVLILIPYSQHGLASCFTWIDFLFLWDVTKCHHLRWLGLWVASPYNMPVPMFHSVPLLLLLTVFYSYKVLESSGDRDVALFLFLQKGTDWDFKPFKHLLNGVTQITENVMTPPYCFYLFHITGWSLSIFLPITDQTSNLFQHKFLWEKKKSYHIIIL